MTNLGCVLKKKGCKHKNSRVGRMHRGKGQRIVVLGPCCGVMKGGTRTTNILAKTEFSNVVVLLFFFFFFSTVCVAFTNRENDQKSCLGYAKFVELFEKPLNED